MGWNILQSWNRRQKSNSPTELEYFYTHTHTHTHNLFIRQKSRHKKGIEDSPTELEYFADFILYQVLIYIIKKRKK
jgi:hypothetical protein